MSKLLGIRSEILYLLKTLIVRNCVAMTQIAHDGSLCHLIQLRLTTLIAGCVAFVKRQRDSDSEHAHKFRLGNAVSGHAFHNSRLCDRGCSRSLAPWKLCDPFGDPMSHTYNGIVGFLLPWRHFVFFSVGDEPSDCPLDAVDKTKRAVSALTVAASHKLTLNQLHHLSARFGVLIDLCVDRRLLCSARV